MSARVTVTKERVELVKSYVNNPKYAALTQDELAKLIDVPSTTINRIANGAYDHLLNETETREGDATTFIPYEKLVYLLACERVVHAMFSEADLSEKIDGLFFPSGKIYTAVKVNLPDKVEAKIKELLER